MLPLLQSLWRPKRPPISVLPLVPLVFLILKPSLGHKQRGILILPHCLLHLPTALAHTRAQRRLGGLKGVFASWVVQQYVMHPLTISGADIGLLYEEGETIKKEKGEGKDGRK